MDGGLWYRQGLATRSGRIIKVTMHLAKMEESLLHVCIEISEACHGCVTIFRVLESRLGIPLRDPGTTLTLSAPKAASLHCWDSIAMIFLTSN